MSKPWPDEVRAMVDALSLEGVSVQAVPHAGGWRVFVPGASADYDPALRVWHKDGHAKACATTVLESLFAIARGEQTIADRILAAVPTALVTTTTDGIEVTVGSKSVRLKRERNGWSLGDDLFTSDDRVVEHAKAMAAEQAPRPLLDRLREAVPGLEWESDGEAVVGRRLGRPQNVDAAIRDGKLLCWLNSPREPHAVQIECPSDDECVRIVTEWYAKTHAAPATTQATASTPSPRELAAHELAARFQREFPDATVGFAGDGSRVWVEQWSERVEWAQSPGSVDRWEHYSRIATTTQWVIATTRDVLDAAAKRRGHSTVTINGSILDTDALTRAIEEHTKREKAHAAKGPTMTTQTKTQALTQTIKLDASEAAWRTAGSQFVKLAREPLVGLLTRHLAPNDDAFRARLAAFLETELGTALLASMLSATLSALPQTTGEVPQKLARELRVKAMATAGDELASVLSGPLLQVMRLYLQDPAGAPAAAHALDAPQSTGVEWATQGEKVAK